MTKNNIYKYILYALLSVLYCLSCSEEKGNYDYIAINEIEIDGIDKKYTIGMEDGLTIKPVIKSSISGNENDYKYEWLILNIRVNDIVYQEYLISSDKYLDNVWLKLSGGIYNFFYRITDTKTGVKWTSNIFQVEIVNEIVSGFFILSDVDDKTRVDFISYYNDTLNLKLDILSKIDSKYPSFGKPISSSCYSDRNSPKMGALPEDGQYAVCILTNTGAYRLNPGSFTYDPLYNLNYNYIGSIPTGFFATKIYNSKSKVILADNKNDLYFYDPIFSIFWTMGIYLNKTVEGIHFNVAPHVGFVQEGSVFYDIDSKSFVAQKASQNFANYYPESLESEFNGLTFKFNKTGKDILFLHARNEPNNNGMVYTLLKDPITKEVFMGAFTVSDGKQT